MKTTESVLRTSGLPTDLVDHMLANVKRCSEPCPVCRVGRGHFCVDVAGTVTVDRIHPQRLAFIEADDLTRAAFRR